jgi:signal transduction histidine kinase
VHRLRAAFAWGGALLNAGVLVATIGVAATLEADVATFSERTLPPALALALAGVAALVPAGVLARSHEVLASAGLALAGTAVLLPLWAAWPYLDVRWRTLLLAAGPLAVAGLALMVRSWAGTILGLAAVLLHALTYDGFRDLGCARVCLEAPALLDLPTQGSALVVACILIAAAGLVLLRARQLSGEAFVVATGAVCLAATALVRWATVSDGDVYGALLLVNVLIPGLVALPAVIKWADLWRRRSAARHLAGNLAENPEALIALADRVDVSLLTPGQQLALRNAQLAEEASARLAEVRASQRRIVAASDAERRRIERDLHDGVQQRLVGVLMHVSGRGMDEVEEQVRTVLADLRAFSRGVFPPVLEEEGLAVALEELAATADALLELDVRLDRPVPPEHARALYSLAALADHGRSTLSLHEAGRDIAVVISGSAARHAPDLTQVEDRFGALGGTLTLTDRGIEGRLLCVW